MSPERALRLMDDVMLLQVAVSARSAVPVAA
jgi:hypothetical protein